MIARNISIVLKPNTLNDFTQTFEKEVIPTLRKQDGFRDEIALASDDSTHITAISFWDTKVQAETYAVTTYPSVLKALDKFLDGPPKVRVSTVINSTSHKLTAATVSQGGNQSQSGNKGQGQSGRDEQQERKPAQSQGGSQGQQGQKGQQEGDSGQRDQQNKERKPA